MIKLCPDESNVIHANENIKSANYNLHANFWNFWSIYFCFVMKKNHFTEKLLLWPQVPLKKFESKLKNFLLKDL